MYCDFFEEKVERKIVCYRDFSKFEINQMTREIFYIDCESITEIKGVDNIKEAITSNVTRGHDTYAPMICKRVT